MKAIIRFVFLLIATCVAFACENQSQPVHRVRGVGTTAPDAFTVAKNSKEDVHTRIEAVSYLNQGQKRQLQRELLKDLPGNYDLKTLDAVNLLARVGDKDAIAKLDQIRHSGAHDKLITAADLAIDEIHKRNQ